MVPGSEIRKVEAQAEGMAALWVTPSGKHHVIVAVTAQQTVVMTLNVRSGTMEREGVGSPTEAAEKVSAKLRLLP